MAVIKIVPMPGAKGDKGDDGATGAQGPQGPIGSTGAAGADALWNYNGAWQSNAAYAVGDVVTYQGQLYYTKAITTAGTLPTDTTKFDLIAEKGADGEPGLNGLEGEQGPQGEPGPQGEQGPGGLNAVWAFTGEYNPGSQYAVGDLVTYEGQTWYRKDANGGNVGDTPSVGSFWDLIAAKGEDGEQGPQGEPGPAGSFVYKSGAVPSSHHGSAGDLKNDIKYDDTHMYVCVADYTDGSAIIWKRINWASGNW